MIPILPVLLADAYKIGHVDQYPKGTEFVYSNRTPRGSRLSGVTHKVVFGNQYFLLEYLVNQFQTNFFGQPRKVVVDWYHRVVKNMLGRDRVEHIEALWDLGYLPLRIKALPEGSRVPMRVPELTIVNTHKKFFWLTNALETLMESVLWEPGNSATLAFDYRLAFEAFAKATGADRSFCKFQGHDFSMRGMHGTESAMLSGAAHATCFLGSDTVPVIPFLECYYYADSDKEMVITSVPATEHSVMSVGMQANEFDSLDHIIFDVYPTGIVSCVSDTWDLWKVITEYLPSRKERILERAGKVVIRPDSGNPADILCGTKNGKGTTPQERGVIQLLWDIFGGTTTADGYRQLDSHIGTIYGDSITREIRDEILSRLKIMGFASTNVVLGIGSFTYAYNTRDTLGQAMKATSAKVNGERRAISKNPVTDSGIKKSAVGLLRVDKVDGEFVLRENVSEADEQGGELQIIFENGVLHNTVSLSQIRQRIDAEILRLVG